MVKYIFCGICQLNISATPRERLRKKVLQCSFLPSFSSENDGDFLEDLLLLLKLFFLEKADVTNVER